MNTINQSLSENKSWLYILECENSTEITSALKNGSFFVKRFISMEAIITACEMDSPNLVIIDDDSFEEDTSHSSLFACPVIKVSEEADIHHRLSAIRNGYSHLLAKPINKMELTAMIERLLDAQVSDPYKVLIVDDDVVTMQYHAGLLEKEGVVVEQLSLPLKCLDVMKDFHPDLLLLDVSMPEMTGIELTQVIRQFSFYSSIPIIYLSSENDPGKQRMAMQFGGEYFLTKPVEPEKFQIAIISRLKYARQSHRLHQNLNRSLLLNENQHVSLNHHALVSIADIGGDITYVNEKFCEISGYSAVELIGKNHRILKSGYHDDVFFKNLWETISAGNVWKNRVCNRTKQGKNYWVDSTIVPFLDEAGLPYQYVSIRTDVTQLVNNEQRLKLSQNFANIGTWDWDILKGDLYWSDRIAPLFGYKDPKTETTYENFVAAIHPDDRDRVLAAINDCIEKDTVYDIEHRAVWEDGSIHWLHESGNVLRDDDGNAIHMLGVVQDISMRKFTQQQLSESEDLMRSQLDSMSEGMFGLDENGRVIFVNQAACVMLGYVQQDLIGQTMSELIMKGKDGTDTPEFLKHAYDARTETLFKCFGDDTILVEYSSMPILKSDEFNGVVITFIDISGRKRNEKELLHAKEQAERANKAKSQFLSSMSHELRTPMNAIIGFSQLLNMDESIASNDRQKDNVNEILNAGEHLLELINEVLDLSSIESGQSQMSIEPVSFDEVLKESVGLVSGLAVKKGVVISFVGKGKYIDDMSSLSSGVHVLADRLRLKQVLLNLLSNAVKYNSDNGEIRIHCAEVDDLYTISIEDTGAGLSAEQIDGLFQPFNRLGSENSAIEGTGIGLVITKNLVEMMGGSIACQSQEGKGTTFSIELNLYQGESESVFNGEQTDLSAGQLSDDSYHVLYIEDNPANIRLMAQVFAREKSLHLSTVHEPILGLDLVVENKPDLILLDINLPTMDGYMVLAELRKLFGETYPVIAISANAMAKDIEKGMEAGFDSYITKPVDIKSLMNSVYYHLNIKND